MEGSRSDEVHVDVVAGEVERRLDAGRPRPPMTTTSAMAVPPCKFDVFPCIVDDALLLFGASSP